MSALVVRQQLETAVAAITPAIDTVFENVSYTATVGTPYQSVDVAFATPYNGTMGDGFYREIGLLQVTLYYPQKVGSGDAVAQAQRIRAAFPCGRVITTGKVSTIVSGTPAIWAGPRGGDRYSLVVRVPFYANVYP